MSLKLGTQDIAGISQNTKYNAHSLFDFKWSDHVINDMNWLEAEHWSWHSGDTYTDAYNHLVADIEGIISETETIGGYTVTFYRATDGHKIVLADSIDEANVNRIYRNLRVAWYYILDTTNRQFKLPRTQYGFKGIRESYNAGDYIDESLPNITGQVDTAGAYGSSIFTASSGAFYNGTNNGWRTQTQQSTISGASNLLNLDASRSSSTYQDDAPVQERATQMYLYFYVGEYSQTAIEQTAGLNAELFNGKADVDLTNTSDNGKILMSDMGMPSSTYTNLTIGASGSKYVAPASGYYYVRLSSMGTNQYFRLMVKTSSNDLLYATRLMRPNSASYADLYIPIYKGFTLEVEYTASGVEVFRFIYAVGSESEA